MVQRNGQGNGGIRGQEADQLARVVEPAIFEVGLVALNDEGRPQFLARLDDCPANVIAAAVIVKRRDAEALGRGLVA